jgi:hypothetical protein
VQTLKASRFDASERGALDEAVEQRGDFSAALGARGVSDASPKRRAG